MKKWISLCTALCLLLLPGCTPRYTKYQMQFEGYFDVPCTFTGYARSQEEFDKGAQAVKQLVEKYGMLYDIYNSYEGMNNLKTVNDNAGIAPVPVDPAILDLLEFSLEAYGRTQGKINIAMGPVLRLWHDYRTQGNQDPAAAQLPPFAQLQAQAQNTSIEDLVLDRQAGTVFLTKPGMSLDVGALAKGYTAQKATQVATEAGLDSFLLNMGGNVVTKGSPRDGRENWAIGIQNPDAAKDGTGILDTVYIRDLAVVSSGDYQRYYLVDGQRYHHIIDPNTLMPAQLYSHVSVLHPDSARADMLSTALFLCTEEEGRQLLKENQGEAMWVRLDGSVQTTPGYEAVSANAGAQAK